MLLAMLVVMMTLSLGAGVVQEPQMGTCTPLPGICRACTNCHYCANCAKGGGRCSVCAPPSSGSGVGPQAPILPLPPGRLHAVLHD